MNISVLLSNRLINVGVLSWCAAQLLKTLIDYAKHKRFNRERLSGAGGMPSSHAAVTVSAVITSYYMYGFNSAAFALSFIQALIVMYDATGVRFAAGLHAKAINRIVEHLDESEHKTALQQLVPKLNESIGHRMIEVVCGAILGTLIAVAAEWIVRSNFF